LERSLGNHRQIIGREEGDDDDDNPRAASAHPESRGARGVAFLDRQRACDPRRYFSLPAQLGNVTQLSFLRPYLCPRTLGTRPRCAPRRWGRGHSTIPGTRGTHLPRSRAASSTRWSSLEQSASSYSSQLRPAVSEAASPPLVSQRVHRTVSPSRGSAIPRTSLLSRQDRER
jgi:hypothetical protein